MKFEFFIEHIFLGYLFYGILIGRFPWKSFFEILTALLLMLRITLFTCLMNFWEFYGVSFLVIIFHKIPNIIELLPRYV
jgi:hypothetical protein